MTTAIAPVNAPAYGSPEWQLERRQYVQASDVPMILGLSPYGGKYDVFLAKRGLATTEENDAMWWGHVHEPGIARAYARRFPDVTLEEVGTLPHPKYPWLRATVDRMVHAPDGVFPLEIKSTSAYLGDRWGDEGTDDIPDHVLVQAQVQLMVLEKRFGHACVLVGGNDFRAPYLVEADDELQEMIVDQCHDFYQRQMVQGDEPEIDGPNAEQHLRKKYQSHSDVVLPATEDDVPLLVEYFAVNAQLKQLDMRKDELKASLMQRIGGNYGITCDAGKVIWYETKGRESIDTKGLIKQLNVPSDVLLSFTKRGAPSRTFRAYPKGD